MSKPKTTQPTMSDLSDLSFLERLTVRLAILIYYTLGFIVIALFLFLLADGMIDYLTLGKYDITTF